MGRALRIGARLLLLVVVLGTAYVAITFVQVWRAMDADSHDPAEAIVVLGAAQYDGTPSPRLRARLDHAFDLHQQGVAPVVVVTGGKQPGDRFTEAAASYRHLRDLGLADEDILREEQGLNTWQQLAAVARLLRSRGLEDVVLVSDDYHAYRVDRIADELGLEAQVSPVDPRLGGFERVKAMTRETAAVAVGRIIGFRRLVDLDDQLSGVRPLRAVG